MANFVNTMRGIFYIISFHVMKYSLGLKTTACKRPSVIPSVNNSMPI